MNKVRGVDVLAVLRRKLENIISGYRINEDDADWLRGLVHKSAIAALSAPQPPAEAQPVVLPHIKQAGDDWSPMDKRWVQGWNACAEYARDINPNALHESDHPPPSAPVGVEGTSLNEPFGNSEQLREAVAGFLSVSFPPEFDGCPDEVKQAYRYWHGRLRRFAGAMNFQKATEAAAFAQQPAAVDEAMVEAVRHRVGCHDGLDITPAQVRSVLKHWRIESLAAQQGGSDNDR